MTLSCLVMALLRTPFPRLFALWFVVSAPYSFAQAGGLGQDTLNRLDDMGRRQGFWKVAAPDADKPGYRPGQVIEEGRYTNSRRIGLWRRYWPNGKVMSEITYQMGRPRGAYKTYYPDGTAEEEGIWDLDRNTGKFRRWHPNGQPAQEFMFTADGVRDGEQKYYHENGRIAVQVEVELGKEEGTLKRYTADGQLQQVAVFHGGEIDPAASRYLKPAPHATEVKEGPDAPAAPMVTPEETTNAIAFRENGFNTLYDRQLRLSQQGDFRQGRLWNGRRYSYDKDGFLRRIQVFRQGLYAGDAVITEEDRR